MSIQRWSTMCVAAFAASGLVASVLASYAGPCSHDIDRTQVQVDTWLNANASAGPATRESTAATAHRQPTPSSIEAAEAKLGDVSTQTVEAVRAAMTRAVEADRAGDLSACEQALADARRALSP